MPVLLQKMKRFVAFGANRGKNLHLYRTYIDGDNTPVKILEKSLGGVIIHLEFDKDNRMLKATSSENYEVSYSIDK